MIQVLLLKRILMHDKSTPLIRFIVFAALFSFAITSTNFADDPPEFIDPGEGYSYIGNIQSRHAREIESSNWSIGAETMDRDFTIYRHWREHLGPLGVKKARIQSILTISSQP